jgi:uncharacterized protein involved in outer membrane biogenesis
MKKFLRHLIGWTLSICLILIIAASIIYLRAPVYAEKHLSHKLKVPVTIGDISFFLNSIVVKDFEIANLPDHYLKKACSFKVLKAENNIFTYLDDVVTLEQITLEDIYLGLEFDNAKGTNGNWTTLMKNLDDSLTKVDKEDTQTIEIKKLVLKNIQVDLVYRSAGGKVKKFKPIPEIILYNINSSEGLPSEQIMKSVLGQMLKSVFVKENLKNMFGEVFTDPQGAMDTILSPLKSVF